VQIKANLKDFLGDATASAINNTSGGMGKKDASINAIQNKACRAYGFVAKFSTQTFIVLSHSINLLIRMFTPFFLLFLFLI
jgi:hypothetical protein